MGLLGLGVFVHESGRHSRHDAGTFLNWTEDARDVTTPIAEDFTAIRARLEAIRAQERDPAAEPAPATGPRLTQPVDFYAWLTSGTLWSAGGPVTG